MRPLVIVFGLAVLFGAACSSDTGPTSTPQQSADPTPTATDRTGDSGPTNTVNESTYDVNCMDPVLGKSVTDEIVYSGRAATDEELAKILHCKLRLDYDKSSQEGRESGAGEESIILGQTRYDIECIDNELGVDRANEIFNDKAKMTSEEMDKVRHCTR